MNVLKDKYGRIHDYVRISLIDKCNLNCIYCNPVNRSGHAAITNDVLTADNIIRIIKILVSELGVKKIRFTGGEPLLRKDFEFILNALKILKNSSPFKIGVTTNATKLEENLEMLCNNGVDYLNISLDTLKKEKFNDITGSNLFAKTIDSINKALLFRFDQIRVNAVIIKGVNDDELIDFIDYFVDTEINLRFIEYMPFGNNGWQKNGFVSCSDMKNIISRKYHLQKINNVVKIAEDFSVIGHKGIVSFISPISKHFCSTCNRLRITSNGDIKLCLFSKANIYLLKEILSGKNYNDDDVKNYFISILDGKEEAHPDIDELIRLDNNNMLSIGG